MIGLVDFVRGLVAVGLGISATIVLGPLGSLLVAIHRLCGVDDPTRVHPVIAVVGIWAWFVHRVCIETVLGIRLCVHGRVRRVDPDERVILISNHPSFVAVASLVYYVWTNLSTDFIAVAKEEYRKEPFVGRFLAGIRAVIFINRSSKEATARAIAGELLANFRLGSIAILFPDATRPTAEKIEANRREYEGRVPGLAHWPKHTLLPRVGALESMLALFPNKKVRVINVTMGSSGDDTFLRSWLFLARTKLHIAIHDQLMGQVPGDLLLSELNEMWRVKNLDIARWKGEYVYTKAFTRAVLEKC